MNKKKIIPLTILIISLFLANTVAAGKIGIIVNKHLYPSIQTSITMYINDIKNIEGKDVWLDGITFDESNDKKELRDSLRYYYGNDGLEGAILIGDLPMCDFLTDETHERDIFPCDLYYMDLNGTWTPEDLPDTHSGSKSAEIWISRLVCSVLTHYANQTEVQILKSYFDRVHLRMYGQDNQPSTYLIAGMYGEWPSLESENKSYLGYNSNNIESFRTYSDSTDPVFKEKWANALIAGKEYAYIYSHAGGLPYRHKFGYYIYHIYEDTTNCRFNNVYCCQNARYTTANMCGAYATDDKGLVSIGAAKSGSMRPGSYRPYNEPLGQGKSFGEAFRGWYNSEGLSSISWHYGMTVQGVGTLHIQPYDPPADNKAPTGLALSGQSINENAGANAFIGILSTTDPDAGQFHTYRLIYGDGDTDNDSFTITGDTLRANISFDYESQNTYSVRVRTIDNGTGNLWYEKAFTITINNVNEAPTALVLSNQSISENAGVNVTIGTFSSTDPEINQTHTYTLVGGTGDVDNGSFTISGNTVLAIISFDYETKSSYNIRVRTTDNGTGNLWFEETFTIAINNVNEAPTAVALSNHTINESAGANATVGAFSTTDPDTGQTYTYSLVTGTGSIDNASFTISGNTLLANTSFDYEVKNSYSIRVRTTDNGTGNLWYEEVFTVLVVNINEAPTALALTGQDINENAGANIPVGTLSSSDPDIGQTHTYTLVSGAGGIDNASFYISGNTLLANSSFDYETKNSYSIRVRTTDNGIPAQLCENVFTITVINVNETPFDIAVDNLAIREKYLGANIGNVTAADPDAGDTHTFTLDDTRFEIVSDILKLKQGVGLNYDIETAVPIQITVTDIGHLSFTKNFTVTVIDHTETTGLYSKHSFFVIPNPVIKQTGNKVTFIFNAGQIVSAELKIFDSVGNLVYESPPGAGMDGKFYWGLENKHGRIVGIGMYIVLLKVTETNGYKKTLKTFVGVKGITK